MTFSGVDLLIRAAWIGTAVIWATEAVATKQTERAEPAGSRVGHLVTFAIAFGLLFWPALRQGPLAWRVIPFSTWAGAAALLLTFAGSGLAVWARFCLGGNWSSIVELKKGHTLVRTGPYRIVRHPIYAGLLAAMLGSALACGELGALLGVVLAFAGWLAKARLEESYLAAQFGPGYWEYRRQVKTLIPFVL